jgi:branched-chain amino acid transport system permease protein
MIPAPNQTPLWLHLAAKGGFLLIAVSVPSVMGLSANDWWFRLSTLTLIAASWNLMASAGLVSLGHAAFWGAGGYASLLASNKLGLPYWLALCASMLIGAILGSGIAFVTGRLRGLYFSVGTLALSEALRVLGLMLPNVAGGGEGIYLDTKFFPGSNVVIGTAIAGAALSILVSWLLLARSPYQYALRAMRNNEDSAMMIGINPLRIRVAITGLSAAIAALAGGISAFNSGFLDPRIAFDLHLTIMAKVAPVLGGVYTIFGPVLGALITNLISDLARTLFGLTQGLSLFLFGVIIVLMILFMPLGTLGTYHQLKERQRTRKAVPSFSGKTTTGGEPA